MPPTIKIDQDVWAALQKEAQPFVDTPNDVLRKLLKLDGASLEGSRGSSPSAKMARIRKGEKTNKKDFYVPILRAITDMNGRGPVSKVLDSVGVAMRDRFNDVDLQPLASGQIRWRNTAQWARNEMVKYMNPPLLDPHSPNGWWVTTDAGREYLRTQS
jgi:hypothetical protein